MKQRIFLLLFTCFNVISYTSADKNGKFSLFWDQQSRSFALKPHESSSNPFWVASASFENGVNETGWAYLEVYTNGAYDDRMQAYAAGIMEGSTTRDFISMAWENTYSGYCKTPLSEFCQKLEKYLQQNADWMSKQIEIHASTDPYWHQVQLYLDQISGLIDGYHGVYNSTPKYTVDVTGLLITQIGGDLEDLAVALTGDDTRVLGSGSCSALIKLLPGNADLFVSQDTWTGLNEMLRILKKYDFAFSMDGRGKDLLPGKAMTFSSQPGLILSGDDFYTMSSGLVAIETTIGNDNADLWKYVTPEDSVLEGIRNMVANRMAGSAAEWAEIFSRYNSGTYNNEWMVVDYTKFKPGKNLPQKGVLYVLEQIPGMIVSKDMTSFLQEKTYWPSYNSPYFPEIFNASGGPAKVAKYGDWFTYDHTPRANIFRRDHVKVVDVPSMIKLMRYNDYKNDPLSACDCDPPYSGENSIQARSDLNPANGSYPFSALGHRNHAGIDMKLTTSDLVKELQFISQAGPPFENVPAFQWSKSDYRDSVKHVGHPDLFMFKPITHQWGSKP